MPKFIGKITRDDASDFKLVDGQDVDIRNATNLIGATLADGDFLLLDDSGETHGEASTGRVTLSQIKTYIQTGNLSITGDISAAGGDLTVTNALNAGGLIIKGNEANNAGIELWADEGDDAADKWQIESSATDNKLYFYSYESSNWVSKLVITTAGVVTTSGDLYVGGNDIIMAAASAATLKVQASSGTDTAGGNLTISAGQGTGTGDGGDIIFQVADGAGGSGAGVNSLATALTIFDDKSATFTAGVTATQFNGALSGIASKATSFHNITTNTSTDSTHYLVFVDGTTTTESPELDTGLTYNPSSGLLTADGFAGALTGTASNVTVSDSTANTNFPVIFHDESNALLDDTGALRYNPSTGTLLVPNLSVSGTTTQVDTVTMNAQNAVVFEGATPDDHETTLSIVDTTADHTQYLINQGGYIPLLSAATTTQISATPEELNVLDGVTAGTVTASKGVVVDSSKDITGFNQITSTSFVGSLTGNASTVTNGVYTTSKINVLAATTSAELAGVISDETGSGSLVFSNTPNLTTPVFNGGAALKNGATSAGFLYFYEDSDNGTNKVTLLGPASTDDVTINLPSTAGTLALTSDTFDTITKSIDNTTAGTLIGHDVNITRAGNVSSGTDTITGIDLDMSTTGASGGTINSTGVDINMTGDTGGTSELIGLNINVSGADSNRGMILRATGSGARQFIFEYDDDNYGTVFVNDSGTLRMEAVGASSSSVILEGGSVLFASATTKLSNETAVVSYSGSGASYKSTLQLKGNYGYFGNAWRHFYIETSDDSATKIYNNAHDTSNAAQIGDIEIESTKNILLDAAVDVILDPATGVTHFRDAGDTDDEFKITVVGDTGATTLETVSDAADGHLSIVADGHVEFDGCGVGFDLVTPTYNASDTNVDFRTGNKQYLTFGSGNIADLNLIFPATSGNFTLLLKQDATDGSRTIAADGYLVFGSDGSTPATGSATVKFAGGSNPTLTTDVNHVDILSFFWDADNQVAYGAATLDFQD